MYSAAGYMVDASDSICDPFIHIHPPYEHVTYLHIWSKYSVVAIIVSGIYVTDLCEVNGIVCCVLTHMYANVGSICPYTKRAV